MDVRLQDNLSGIQQNYIATFLWLHEEEDELIIKEIQHIYDSGIRSICVESRTHENFARDGWWSDISLIFNECRKRDMNVWILDDKHFPSGYANGIFREKYKDMQPWGITERHIDIAGPVIDGAAMADCWLEEPDDRILAVTALKHIPNKECFSEAVDITDGITDGMVYFTLPEGMWRIVFLIQTRSGYSERFRIFSDKLTEKATKLFIEEVYQPHYDRFKEFFGNTFLGFFSDEPRYHNNSRSDHFYEETGVPYTHFPWNQRVLERLQTEFGAEAYAVLSGLWFDFENDISERIRYSYMDIITDEYRKNFCNTIADWCHAHGVQYIGHVIEDNNAHAYTGNGTGHYFRTLDGQDMSGIDIVLQQIVPGLTECSNAGYVSYKHMNNEFFHYYLGKLGSSLAHVDSKKKGRAMCEIFGAYGWAEGTKIMKYLMDHMLVRGINYFVPHAFSPKVNDPDCPPNFYDSGRNPQYKYFKNNMDYLNRMSHMLSDGIHHSTCAILYDAENRWMNTDFLPLEKIGKALYDNLYDYDIIPVDCLEQIGEDGCLNGEKYNLLLIPYSDKIPEYVVEKLYKCGIEKIVVSEKEVKDSLFENVILEDLIAYMRKRRFYDVVSTDYEGIFLRYYHYERDGAQIYMLSNEGINHKIQTNLRLSAFKGGKYIEYDAFENTAVQKESMDANVEISLPPYHSILLIFGNVSFENIPEKKEVKPLSTEFIQSEFEISVARGNSQDYIPYKVTSELLNITGACNIPDFSGHIRYDFEFEIHKEGIMTLDLGNVGETAELYLNGEYVGVRLFPPYSFDVTDKIRNGINSIRVIVANHNGYERRDAFSKYLLFEPTGLLGPLSIRKYSWKN